MRLNSHERILLDVEYLRILQELASLDNTSEVIYDKLTHHACDMLRVPIAIVSMVASDYQFFRSYVGLPEPWASRRRTPLPQYSFWQHVIKENKPVAIVDIREDVSVKDCLDLPDRTVVGYLGIPLMLNSSMSLGTFCAIDTAPRNWTQAEIDIMLQLSQILVAEFETRARINLHRATPDDLKLVHEKIEQLINTITPSEDFEKIVTDIWAFRTENML